LNLAPLKRGEKRDHEIFVLVQVRETGGHASHREGNGRDGQVD
jgi:hypothetical protein